MVCARKLRCMIGLAASFGAAENSGPHTRSEACASAGSVQKETVLLQTQRVVKQHLPTDHPFHDSCGCNAKVEGWSSTRNQCFQGSETSDNEAVSCASAASRRGTQGIFDGCGCERGREGWSSTRMRCDAGASTDSSEALACSGEQQSQRRYDDCGCEIGREGWSSTRMRCHPNSETSLEEAQACRTAPAPPPLVGGNPSQPRGNECLCVFDIDRTLTGKQSDTKRCPMNHVLNMEDHGYGGGRATLSELSHVGLQSTFCNDCFLGIVSAGHGSGAHSEWNAYILNNIMRSGPQDNLEALTDGTKTWSYGENVRSPWVLGQRNRYKQRSVEGIRQWYALQQIDIAPGNVYFFGDRTENIEPFRQMGFNSREISCGERDAHTDGGIGYCGATPREIERVQGNLLCASVA